MNIFSRKLRGFTIIGLLALAVNGQARTVCRPFRVHMQATVPGAPSVPEGAQGKDFEADLVETVSAAPTLGEFRQAYDDWRRVHAIRGTEQDRLRYLSCLAFFALKDTDADGIPDWTPLVDGKISSVVYPLDEDQDGDGWANVFDPQPLDKSILGASAAGDGTVPKHLRMSGAAANVQQRLFTEFSIIAVNHSDTHSLFVLDELLTLLRRGFPKGVSQRFSSVKVLYAFSGHDPARLIAAYHPQALAISIGGRMSYGDEPLTAEAKVALLLSLAHEFGHAFIFDQMSADELRRVSTKFGGWELVFAGSASPHLYAKAFFEPHPMKAEVSQTLRHNAGDPAYSGEPQWREANLISGYGMTNVHEWFAESFAARTLRRLGEGGVLGKEWKLLLTGMAGGRSRHHWFNFGNLTDGYVQWLDERMSRSKRE